MNKLLYKRFTTIILVITLLLQISLMSSCNRRYDEDEVISATKILLKDAEKLNVIYYGEGIRWQEDGNQKGSYKRAQQSHLDELGFHTLEELKELTEKTFSDKYSSVIYSTIMSALMSDGKPVSLARYYQMKDTTTGEFVFMVNSNFSPLMTGTVKYDYESIIVTHSKKEKVFAKVTATVTNKEGKSQNKEIVITLIEEKDGWRIDNPIYANYSIENES